MWFNGIPDPWFWKSLYIFIKLVNEGGKGGQESSKSCQRSLWMASIMRIVVITILGEMIFQLFSSSDPLWLWYPCVASFLVIMWFYPNYVFLGPVRTAKGTLEVGFFLAILNPHPMDPPHAHSDSRTRLTGFFDWPVKTEFF